MEGQVAAEAEAVQELGPLGVLEIRHLLHQVKEITVGQAQQLLQTMAVGAGEAPVQ